MKEDQTLGTHGRLILLVDVEERLDIMIFMNLNYK